MSAQPGPALLAPGPVVRLENVGLSHGETRALESVTFDIPAGRMVGLIGPDGVGKSSLLSLIAGAQAVQEGHVDVLDGDMADATHRRLTCPRIAYMPQGLGKNLYPTLSVFENVDFFGRLFGQDKLQRERRIGELLRSTGLAPFTDRPAAKLSGGMKQKLGLCCALIHDPDLLILDEPTTGVDPLSRRQFWELIDAHPRERAGMSVSSPPPIWRRPSALTGWWRWMPATCSPPASPAELLAQTGAGDSRRRLHRAAARGEARAAHRGCVIPPRAARRRATPCHRSGAI